MNIASINPYIRRATPSVLPLPTIFNQRIIFDYELIYIEEGTLLLVYNGTPFLCSSGDILLLCPGISHAVYCTKTTVSQPHIHFDLTFDSLSSERFICFRDYPDLSPSERALIQKNVFSHLSASPFIKISKKAYFIEKFYRIVNNRNYGSLSSKALLLELLELIIYENAPCLSDEPQNEHIASLIKSYIDANYEHEFHLSDLEKYFCYSKFYIDKLFKQHVGVSVIKYRNQLRMENSVKLLKEHSVSETAQTLGFSSVFAFSRAFRLYYGVSPTKYFDKSD